MKIPKAFQLAGYTFTVEIIKDKDWPHADCMGLMAPHQQKVFIRGGTRSSMEHTYLHELLHAILGVLNYDELSKNEQLVDSVSALLHQALTSAD